jgi:DNA-binding NtrC family response regulator
VTLRASCREAPLSASQARRKVLIIEDDASIRNVLYVLLAAQQLDGDVATSSRQALAMISRESFDAILLDLRCQNVLPDQMLSQISRLRPNLVGRVLVITGEITDPKSLELIERNCLPHIARNRLTSDFLDQIRSLLGFSNTPKAAS